MGESAIGYSIQEIEDSPSKVSCLRVSLKNPYDTMLGTRVRLSMRFSELVQKAKGAAVATDAINRLLDWNLAAEELFGLERRGVKRGQNFFTVIDARDSFGNFLPEGEMAFLSMTQRGEPVSGFELTAIDATGDRVRFSVLPVVVLAEEDGSSSVVYFLRPMYRRRRADEAIERILSDPDRALTGLGPKTVESDVTLTARQREILRHLAEGLSNAEIASALNISINTVRTHVQALHDRLEVKSRVQAVAKAFREGLI
jgi:DNA-binding NarL/FixJ family response regulator